MENGEVTASQDNGKKRKTEIQIKTLENFFSGDKFPSQMAISNLATSLNLTFKQVRGWFSERRRKEKKEEESLGSGRIFFPNRSVVQASDCGIVKDSIKKKHKQNSLGLLGGKDKRYSNYNRSGYRASMHASESVGFSNKKLAEAYRKRQRQGSLHCNSRHIGHEEIRKAPKQWGKNAMAKTKSSKQRKQLSKCQGIFSSEYILQRIFRKDGPPLGVEFDPVPHGAFDTDRESDDDCLPTCQDIPRGPKRRKVHHSKSSIIDSQSCQRKNGPPKKYGIGKGLMTVWRASVPNAESFPTGVNFMQREAANMCSDFFLSASHDHQSTLNLCQVTKMSQNRQLVKKQRALGKKLQEKRKPSIQKRKVEGNKTGNPKKAHVPKCKLADEGTRTEEILDEFMSLMDDEDLELRELQVEPRSLMCSAHMGTNRRHGCSLCKDLLSKFPPQSVKMRQPLCTRPWDSSTEIVKKLLKVFRFLYTHAEMVDMCPFTLDEFAQAFHDKDSLLLGQSHVALLKNLLSGIERELSIGFPVRTVKDCRFLAFLHSVKHQEFDVQFWNRCLNPLTWTEILRQVLLAAGFGSKQNMSLEMRRETKKEGNWMAKYGVCPGTLKGELFNILFEEGSKGLKVSELVKIIQIVGLNLPETVHDLETLICSTLSSDITLFEKISSSAYRLRVSPVNIKGKSGQFQSDSEDSGSVENDSRDVSTSDSDDSNDSEELESSKCERRIIRSKGHRKFGAKSLVEETEIDESHSGEAWMLGLMEGEYSNLSIEEKLDALVALVDLTGAGSSVRMEDSVRTILENAPEIRYHGSGAKIKKASASQRPVLISKASKKGQSPLKNDGSSRPVAHQLQSIYLGSDRRYNSYWLFLGPCDAKDPGHRRVYFESSEDGHWEVIDTEKALDALLSVLDGRGRREAQLLASLEKREAFLCQAMADYMASESEAQQFPRLDQSESDIVTGHGSSPVSDVDNNLNLLNESSKDSLPLSGTIVLELGKNSEEKRQKWDRLQAFDAWIWDAFYNNLDAVKYNKRSDPESLSRCKSCHDLYWRDEKHCTVCHTTFELDFDLEERYTIHVATCREKDLDGIPGHKVLPSQLQSLKAAIHAIEAVMPEEALVANWRRSGHKLWVRRLRRTSSIPELFQVLTDFVGAISEDWLCKSDLVLGFYSALDEIVVFFPTIPQTTSAVALWLLKLDALVACHLERVQSEKPPRSNSRVKGKHASTC